MKPFSLLLLTVLFFSPLAEANSELDGDIIECSGAIKGSYAVDYLRALQAEGREPKLRVLEPNETLSVLQHIGFYGMAKGAFYFSASERNGSDQFDSIHRWEEAAFGFEPVENQRVGNGIPGGCRNPVGRHMAKKRTTASANIFQYDPKLRARMKASPVQYDLILMREWLSQYTDDSALITEINLLWHHPDFLKSEEKIQSLEKLFEKIFFAPKSGLTLCERTEFAQETLKRALRKACEGTSESDLAGIRELQVLDFKRSIILFEQFMFRGFDFAGLSGLETFSANDLPWFGDAMFEGMFRGSPKLKTLSLKKSRIKHITPRMLYGLRELHELDLTDAEVEFIWPGALGGIFSKAGEAATSLKLGGHQSLSTLEPEQFSGLENLKSLSFAGYLFPFSFSTELLTGLKNLQVLDLTDTKGLKLEGRTNENSLRNLRHLNLRRANMHLDKFGPLPQLEILDLSNVFNSFTPKLESMARFSNLRKLNLSQSQFFISEPVFSGLPRLEQLNMMETEFVHASPAQILPRELPPSLRLLEICQKDKDARFWASGLEELRKRNRNLKIRTKDYCEGDWIELTN